MTTNLRKVSPMIFDKYDRCYEEGVEIGFCKNGEKCGGEFPRPNMIKKECLRCPHLSTDTYRKELLK